MSCCGGGRTNVRATQGAPRAGAPDATRAPPTPIGAALRYLGASAILVRGPVSQRAYAFAPGQTLLVDARDSQALVRTQLFRQS